MRSRSRDPFSTEYALLGFLTAGPRHGYAIYQEFSDREGLWLVWRIKQSQLYALLARLEEHGYLSASLEQQGGRPPRKMYQLTPSGRDAFHTWVETPVEHGRQFRLDLMTKLFFAHREGKPVVEKLLAAQRTTCQHWLEDLQRTLAETEEEARYRRLVHQYRTGQVRAMLDWLETCSNELTLSTTAR